MFIEILVLVVAIAAIAFTLIAPKLSSKKKLPVAPAESGKPETVTLHATVESRNYNVRAEGLFKRELISECFVTFTADSGESFVLTVDEETFDSLDKGMSGTVTVTDGKFVGIVLDGGANEG